MTNRWGVTCLALGGLLAAAASCSSNDKPGVFMGGGTGGDSSGSSGNHSGSGSTGKGGKGGGGGTGGKAGAGGAGGTSAGGGGSSGTAGAGGGTVSPLGPKVTITNPVAATDPNVDPVVIGDQITVLCSVTESTLSGAKPVDPSTVQIAILDGTGATIKSVAGTPTENANEYGAPFVLTAIPSGPISFMCSASDTASPVHLGAATNDTLLDRGPDIAISQPAVGSAHNLLGPMDVEFTVSAAPIATGDTQADVSAVALQVAGKSIDLPFKGAGAYKTSVDFNSLFSSPPSGSTPILITAMNKRAHPGKATNAVSYNFVIDSTGPVITLTSPAAGAVIGPAAVLAFTVTDPGSGVDSQTIAVKLNDTPYYYDPKDLLWTADAAGNYTYKMGNTLQGDSTDSQVTVDVLASDNAQNASTGNSRLFYLDTRPPSVDLDPLPTYFTRPGSIGGTLQCSDLFDPVGTAAPNDLSTIKNFGTFRSIVWDQTNGKLGQTVFYFALANQSSVRLYVQPDTTQPLMYHSSPIPGPNCDEIWTGSFPNKKNPNDTPLQFFKLTALPSETTPGGSVDWAVTPGRVPTESFCKAGAMSTSSQLCNGLSDMSILIHHPVVETPHEPVIYAVQPDVGSTTSPVCTGGQWDVAAAISQAMMTTTPKLGWICLAARATDTVGNAGISPPLRICLDDGSMGPARCAGTPPPSCTDNCTPPTRFQPDPASLAGYN